MTFHVLSNLWYEGKTLVAFSETARVKDGPCEILTRAPRELTVVRGPARRGSSIGGPREGKHR
jgi:hypothetical protein